MPFVTDRQSAIDATDFIARFGDDAGFEAAARAEASRDRGNIVHFCRWRQIERLILVMSGEVGEQTLH